MHTKRNMPHKAHRDPEAIASLAYFIAEFTHKASEDDWSLLLQTLAEWSEHEDVDGYFTACVMKTFGMPLITIGGKRPFTLARLRKAILKEKLEHREGVVAEQLDLATADVSERAFLVVCQKLYREIGDVPGHDLQRLVPKISQMAELLLEEILDLGVKTVQEHAQQHNASSSLQPKQRARRASARLAA